MNELELTIKLSNEYNTCFERAFILTDLRKYHCWFDRKNVSNNEVAIKLTLYGITIQYCTSKGPVQESCTYDSILSVTEMYEGIMLRISHKRLLFLPAADNQKDTELLMQAVVMLETHCRYIFRKSYLRINKASLLTQLKFRLRPKQGHYDDTGYTKRALIALICITIFIATVFTLQPVNNRIVSESEAISLLATYSGCDPSYRRGYIKYIDLEFEDYEELTVDNCCSNSDLVEQLDNIPVGTKMHLLIHPKSKNVLQINVNGDIFLEFHDTQTRIWREAAAFAVIGLFMYIAAVGLLIGIIRKKL